MMRRVGSDEIKRARAGRDANGKRRSTIASAVAAAAFERHEEAWFNFHRYDRDGNGTIDMNELGCLLADLKLHVGRAKRSEAQTKEWIQREMRKSDTNGDGVLSFEEFCTYYNKFVAQHRSQMSELYSINTDDVLGKGAFGVVVSGTLLETGENVAVKKLSKKGLKDSLEMLHNEISVWEGLEHAHLVKLLDVFEEPDRIILVTELMRGGDLFRRLRESSEGRFSEPVAARLSAQIVSAVAHLHSNSVVHCDLKPSNILVAEPSECDVGGITVKVADFGLSQTMKLARNEAAAGDDEDDERGTNEDATPSFQKLKLVCGTPAYFAPELVALAQKHFDATEYDAAVDNWALGCVIWELLVGSPPFDASEEDILFFKILDNSLVFPSYVSADARDLILALTKTDADSRLLSADALLHDWLAPHLPSGTL